MLDARSHKGVPKEADPVMGAMASNKPSRNSRPESVIGWCLPRPTTRPVATSSRKMASWMDSSRFRSSLPACLKAEVAPFRASAPRQPCLSWIVRYSFRSKSRSGAQLNQHLA